MSSSLILASPGRIFCASGSKYFRNCFGFDHGTRRPWRAERVYNKVRAVRAEPGFRAGIAPITHISPLPKDKAIQTVP